MNNKLENKLIELGFKVEKDDAYGIFNGYQVNINYRPLSNLPLTGIIYTFNPNYVKVGSDIRLEKLPGKWRSERNYVCFEMTGMTMKSIANSLPAHLSTITNILIRNSALDSNYCPICGEAMDITNSKLYKAHAVVRMHEECCERANEEAKSVNSSTQAMPNNYLRGTLGAILGAIVGGILTAIFYMINFVASLPAFISAILGSLLYKKFGGKPNRTMGWIVAGVSVSIQLLAIFLIYFIAPVIIYAKNGYNLTVIEAFRYTCNSVEGYTRELFVNLLLSGLFSILGASYIIVQMYKIPKEIPLFVEIQ